MSGRRLADHQIAIVGVAGLFPRAGDHREYWQNVVDATDCIEDVPASRWSVDDYHDPDPQAPDRTYSRRGGFIPDVAFDPIEFGLPPNQLEVTSTLQTLSLLVARDVLRDAGATGAQWYDPGRTGVVLGVTGPVPLTHSLSARLTTPVLKEVVRSCGLSQADADLIAEKYVRAFAPWQENSFPGLLANVAAGRIANRLGLGGMTSTVDAACASSMSAVRLAIAELLDGRADMMITGGCDTESSIFMYLCFSKTQALSRTDQIRPFDSAADGTLVGEGIGMLALKRLGDAKRDGDRVYAVIRGIGSSSDGRAKSIYAPLADGQRVALRRAYEDAGCSPATIGLFEAHATGTAVGDATELSALTSVLREADAAPRSAAIGSVKSQVGHLRGAAGAASLIKLALSLHHRTLPPTINVQRPHPVLVEPDAPLYPNTRTRPWIRDPRRPARRAAASAMGFGGVNFHLVLEEHSDVDQRRVLHRTARAHLWHAPDTATLLDRVRSDMPTDEPIPADAARLGFVAADEETAQRLRTVAVEQLTANPDADEWSHPAGIHFRRRARADLRIGALFAGQGGQHLDMGLTAVLNNPVVAGAFDDANDGALADVVYPPASFDVDERKRQESVLHRTENAQPGIAALSAGQFRYLRDLGLTCAGAMGHSFGELGALWAAGSITDADYFRLAYARGAAAAARSDTDPGAMAAIQASRADVDRMLADFPDVSLCNHNGPNQIVVGGGTDAVAALMERCRKRGINVRQVVISAAFHTPYVAHAVDPFRRAVAVSSVAPPRIPVYANSPGARYGADPVANERTLVEQITKPVEFVDGLRAMRADGCTVFVEFGPKQILTQLVRINDPSAVAIPTDAGPLGDSDVALKQAAVHLAVLGAPITGINRHDAPVPTRQPVAESSVLMNAAEYVPESRSAAYRAALADDRLVTPSVVPAGVPAGDQGDLARQHLTLHSRYLEGQLSIAGELAAALRGGGSADLLAVAEQVKQQSLDIGRTHIRANEILASLADLGQRSRPELDPAPVATTAPTPVVVSDPAPEPEPVPAPEPVALDTRFVLDLVADRTGYPVSMLDVSMDLEADLGVDSIKRVQIVGVLQERCPDVPLLGPERLADLRTIGDLAALMSGPAKTAEFDPEAATVPDPPATAPVAPQPVVLTGLPSIDRIDSPFRMSPVAWLVGAGATAEALGGALTSLGWTVTDDVPADGLDLCLMVVDGSDWASSVRALAAAVDVASSAIKPLAAVAGRGDRAAFLTVTSLDGALGLSGRCEPGAAVVGGIGGVVKTLAVEQPDLFCRALDVDPALGTDGVVRAVLAEIHDAAIDVIEVGVDRSGRRTIVPGPYGMRRQPAGLRPGSPEPTVGADDVLVVSGGARGVTAACVRELAARTEARFVLIGRTALGAEPDWAIGVPDDQLGSALAGHDMTPRELRATRDRLLTQREIRATLDALGDRADYVAVDVTDHDAVRQALAPFRSRVTGIVHGAGVVADALLTDKAPGSALTVLNTKIIGLRALLDALAEAPLRHVVAFTSVAGLYGNAGQADYATANEALCRVVASVKHRRPDWHVTAIDWSAWAGGMVTPELRDLFRQRGVGLLSLDAGARIFADQFTAGRADDVRVQAGPAGALTPGRTPATRRDFAARRDLAAIADTEVLRAHRIEANPVLPATFALGWLVNVLERANPGLRVVECRRFEVHKGIVFNPGRGLEYVVESENRDEREVRARVRGESGTPHYSGTFVLADQPAGLPEIRSHQIGAGLPCPYYESGELFHGKELQGIRRVLDSTGDQLVLECQLDDAVVQHGAFAGALHSPVLMDVVLQGVCVLAARLLGEACLPLGIDRVEYFAPLPDDAPFVVVVGEPRPSGAGMRVAVTACEPNGSVLMRLTGVSVVPTPGLAAKFAGAAAGRGDA